MSEPLPDLSARLDGARAAGRWPSGTAVVTSASGTATAVTGTVDGSPAGPAPTPDTAYRIASISKTLTAVLVLRLRDEGRLDLADRLEDHLPGTPVGRVTIAQLLSHTGGLRAELDAPWWERSRPRSLVEVTAQASFVFGPGQRFHYSNVGYALLGAVVERLRAAAWEDVLRAELLEPLGMRHTGLQPRGPEAPGLAVHPERDLLHDEPRMDGGAMSPAGLLWSTAEDLGRWCRFVAGDTAGVLSRDTLDEMCTPATIVEPPQRGAWTSAHCLGFALVTHEGESYVGHTGSIPGFTSGFRVHRPTAIGAAALCNSTSGTAAQTALELCSAAVARARWESPGAGAADLLAHAGVWYWGPVRYVVTPEPDGFRLAVPSGGTRDCTFRRAADGDFVGLDGYFAGERARFVTEPDGITWLDVASFCYTRAPYDPAAPIPGGVSGRGWYAPGTPPA